MTTKLRKTGIDILGDMPWGTHFCHFYETKQDLLDILIPYFKAGLENNEFCMWIVFEPLSEEQARDALIRAITDAERYLAKGHIEIVSYTEWYLRENTFDLERVINGWKEKLTQTLARGYDGMRVNGNEARLTEKDWKDFAEYEKKLNELISNLQMMVLCTYPLATTSAFDLFDVARTHQFAIARRQGKWEVLETPELRQAKIEIKRQNAELEQRVLERSSELAVVNNELTKEIARRGKIEEELRQNERDLAEAQRVARLGNWTFDIMANTVRWSEALCRIFDVEKTEFGGAYESFINRVHPDDKSLVLEMNRRARERGEPFEIEYRIVTHHGRVKHIREIGYAIKDATGRVAGLFGTAQDITEHKRTEEALQQSEKELRALFAAMTDIVLVLDAEGRYVRIAPTNPVNLYRPAEELLGKKVQDVLPEEDAEKILHQIRLSLESHQAINFEYKLVIGPREVWFDSTISPLTEDTVFWIAHDITERRQAETELIESERKFRLIAETVTEVFWLADVPTCPDIVYQPGLRARLETHM
jgi:PAS domain S-box-containing protein